MAQLNYKHAPDGCWPGERLVFNALKNNLSDDFFVWYEPTLFGNKFSFRPDFVILGRAVGLIVVEVKDWSIKGIHKASRDTFEIYDGGVIVTRTNPEKQVSQHKFALKDQLQNFQATDPEKFALLQRQSGPHKGKLVVPITSFVAFPNISRAQWAASELSKVINEDFVLLQEDLKGDLEERFLYAPIFKPDLSPQQIQTLKWMLYPEIHVPRGDGKTLDPEQMSLTRQDTYLPPEHNDLIKKMQVKLVRGVVGSGKTLILLYRAKYISEQNPNWRVLVLTYNKALMNYLRQVFVQIGGDPERVEIVNFHKWCHDLLLPQGLFHNPLSTRSQRGLIKKLIRETGISTFSADFLAEEFDWIKERIHYQKWEDYPNSSQVKRVGRGHGLGGDEDQKRKQIYELFCRYQAHLEQTNQSDWAEVPVEMLRALDQGIVEPEQYNAILIDEGQDFAPSWFRVVIQMIRPATNMLFIVGDGAQRIYRRDFTWKELGLGVSSQNSFVLSRSYRSTREIVDVALEAVRDSQTILEDLKSTGDSIVEPDQTYAGFEHGPLPVLLSFESPEQEYIGIAKEVLSLLKQGYLPQDIVVLHRHREKIEKAVEVLRKHGVPCKAATKDLDITKAVVKVCTLHSAKGLEFEVVFVCGLENFSPELPVDISTEEFQQILDQEKKLLYVGMTRARRILYVSYSGLEPNWIVPRIQKKLSELKPKYSVKNVADPV